MTIQLTPHEARSYFALYLGLAFYSVVGLGACASSNLPPTWRDRLEKHTPQPSTPPPPQHAGVKPPAPLLYEITAYSHYCTMRGDGRPDLPRPGANGRWPVPHVTVAADTAHHPFGRELLIEGLGYRTVGDRGRDIKGPHRLDLFLPSCREARLFGRQWRRVILVPVETTEMERGMIDPKGEGQ